MVFCIIIEGDIDVSSVLKHTFIVICEEDILLFKLGWVTFMVCHMCSIKNFVLNSRSLVLSICFN